MGELCAGVEHASFAGSVEAEALEREQVPEDHRQDDPQRNRDRDGKSLLASRPRLVSPIYLPKGEVEQSHADLATYGTTIRARRR
jgi:hypothetical protein